MLWFLLCSLATVILGQAEFGREAPPPKAKSGLSKSDLELLQIGNPFSMSHFYSEDAITSAQNPAVPWYSGLPGMPFLKKLQQNNKHLGFRVIPGVDGSVYVPSYYPNYTPFMGQPVLTPVFPHGK
ncbi:unnamed protein product, partial [Mesorhabditis belari]|uniref:Uncharacterized protein n=1 Tax=Mesorhabditis belari TaxID=2138241 RepID=A0AAF3F0L1_9BILA